jgi:hypothetical protein
MIPIQTFYRSLAKHFVGLPRLSPFGGLFWVMISLVPSLPSVAQNLSVPSQRALEIGQIRGNVIYQNQNQQKRPAKVGDRLQATGEGVITQTRSFTLLLIDSEIGRINVFESTDLRVKRLDITPSGGRVTLLSVIQGQVRLRIRPFTNPDSRFEVETPAGVTGVRGTEFGVGVGPSGKTTVATLVGIIAASAQGETVLVEKGFGSIIIPGEPPTSPQPFTNDVSLRAVRLLRTSLGTVEVKGQVEPFNLVWIDDRPVDVGKDGKLRATIPLPVNPYLRIRVQSPLGKERVYYSLIR